MWPLSLCLSVFSAHPNLLLQAASNGDVAKLRKVVLATPLVELDLDGALAAAAASARVNAMAFLVDSGAADLDRALLAAAMRDHVSAVQFLLSSDRIAPASNLRGAQLVASSTGALNAEWILTMRLRERKR